MYALAWILRNTDLKYSKYYSLLMLGSNHIIFAPETQQSNTLMYIATNWTGWFFENSLQFHECHV